MKKLGRLFFRYRNILGPIVFVVALAIGRPRAPFGSMDLDTVFDIVGACIAFAGEALRALTIGYEYIVRGGRNRQVYADKLVQGGVFAHCRNPLYVGNLLITLGLALVIHSYGFYFIVIPFMVIAYAAIVNTEEAYLRERFGDEYADYCERVNRWVPRLSGFRKSVDGMHFNWQRVVVKEYNTLFVLVLGLVCLRVWGRYAEAGAAALPTTPVIAVWFAAWASLYLCVRTLKKTGYLTG